MRAAAAARPRAAPCGAPPRRRAPTLARLAGRSTPVRAASPRLAPPVGRPAPRPRASTAPLAALPPDADEPPPPGFVGRLLRPLRDFGFGRASFWEGGVGLFVLTGVGETRGQGGGGRGREGSVGRALAHRLAAASAVCGAAARARQPPSSSPGFLFVLITWARGGKLGRRGRPYQCVIEFPLACGISVGTPVRIRGVPVGSVLSVESSLESVAVLAEIRDAGTVIPRNAVIEANQSGLIAEPLVDVTPVAPLPPPGGASPLDAAACEAEGAIVCHRGRIAGVPGVAMDDLVHVMTRMAKKFEAADGVDRALDTAELAAAALEDARPLLARAAQLADEVAPLLADLRAGGLLGSVESLASTAAAAAADVRALQGDVLTPDNVVALRDAVRCLTRTLEHVEGVARDVGGVTGDARVRGNLKQLIEALSRIVVD